MPRAAMGYDHIVAYDFAKERACNNFRFCIPSSPILQSQKLEIERLFLHFLFNLTHQLSLL